MLAFLVRVGLSEGSEERATDAAALADAATQRVLGLGGTQCIVYGHGGFPSEHATELLARVTALDGSDRWLDEGRSWVGDVEGAASALGGELLGRAGPRAWIVRGDPVVAIELRETSVAGVSAWRTADSVQPVPCEGLVD